MADPRLPKNPRPAPAPERSRDAARDKSRTDFRRKRRTPRDRGRARSRRRDISDVRKLSPAEREIVAQVGRFRSVAIEDFKQHLPQSLCDSPVRTVRALKELKLVRSQYINIPAMKDSNKRTAGVHDRSQSKPSTRTPKMEVVVLTHKGAEWLRSNGYDEAIAGPLRPGLAKPREAFHDAHLYTMAQSEIALLKEYGARNFNALTDSALKQQLYRERARLIAEGHSRDDAHMEAAEAFGIAIQDGKFALPDVRLEYELEDGSRYATDLELTTDTYSAAHIAAKNAAGFQSYHMNKIGSILRVEGTGKKGGRPWDEDWMARSFTR